MSRPSDAIERAFEEPEVENPRLGPVEWLRWAWRQLTSMRTALLLLLALAIAAVPGSLIPQQSADPNGVLQWKQSNPGLVGVVDIFQGFDVYSSVWFSAIYLLLFVSLVGCVVPRAGHHWRALRAAPPRTPARFDRLPAQRTVETTGSVDEAVDSAEALLRRKGYRVTRYGTSVSAERGYLRETGNLLFHTALVGVLIAVFVGGGFTYTGSRVLVVGQTFVNTPAEYDSLSPGRFVNEGTLARYALTLDSFAVQYEQRNINALGQPIDYTAEISSRNPGGTATRQTLKVNSPLSIDGTDVYLLGNGYAPVVTVRNADGSVAFSGAVPFRPTDSKMTSLGVIKAPNTTDQAKQLGFQGFLYPTAVRSTTTGAFASIFPSLGSPVVSLNLWVGDLGGADGTPQNVYVLDNTKMKQIAGPKTANAAIQLTRSDPTATLPDGLGTIHLDGIKRFVSLDVHHDPAQGWVATFVALAVLGLIVSLLVPRRRMWIRATAAEDGALRLEYAGLARGDDPGLDRAVQELADEYAAPSAERLRLTR